MMWHKHLYALVNCYTPKFGLASSVLSLVLSVLGNISGSFIIVNLLPLGHCHPFLITTFLIYIEQLTFSKFFWLFILSVSNLSSKGIFFL